jgi:hypothetical protein
MRGASVAHAPQRMHCQCVRMWGGFKCGDSRQPAACLHEELLFVLAVRLLQREEPAAATQYSRAATCGRRAVLAYSDMRFGGQTRAEPSRALGMSAVTR